MTRRVMLGLLAGGLAYFAGARADNPTVPITVKAVRIDQGGGKEYEYCRLEASVPGLTGNTNYHVEFRVEADGQGSDDPLPYADSGTKTASPAGVLDATMTGSVHNPLRRTDTPIPWATLHFYCSVTVYDMTTGLPIWTSGNQYVLVEYQ